MKLYDIVFSPTGGTKKVANSLISVMEGELTTVDLTDYKLDFNSVLLNEEDVAIISVPSYGGRVPAVAVERLSMIQANGAKAVLVCVYGNRAYEDTLIELQDIAKQAGFQVVAAVTAIAEHSIAHQFAAGRPDAQDAMKLCDFAKQIQKKIYTKDVSEPILPGNRPYKKSGGVGMVPKPTKECTSCGRCATECPVQAIYIANPKKVDEKKCISCMRCISVCPQSARKLNPVMLSAANLMLKKSCSKRKECELFL